jgi:hypothetical protein
MTSRAQRRHHLKTPPSKSRLRTGGEGRIRTYDAACTAWRSSEPLPSATQPPLHAGATQIWGQPAK